MNENAFGINEFIIHTESWAGRERQQKKLKKTEYNFFN